MTNPALVTRSLLSQLLDRVNFTPETALRLKGWPATIQWVIDGSAYYWRSDGKELHSTGPAEADLRLICTQETLRNVVDRRLPFFMGVWGTGEIKFEGEFGDAYRLGYLLLSDKRQRQVIFVSHCWLNINARFPEGAAYPGADTDVLKVLLDKGLGIIQMPCPEYECLGLEKYRYGQIKGDDLRTCFRHSAEVVLKQIKDYLALGFDIAGIMGMNPSPSCGVGISKGKGTILGIDRDTSEVQESGVFIEELEKLLARDGITGIKIFGVRRLMTGETCLEQRIADLQSQIQ